MSNNRLRELLQAARLHVTGMGAWTAGGRGVAELWQGALAGQSPARWREILPIGGHGRLPVCEAADPELNHPSLRKLRRMDRSTFLAAAAAWEAWRDAGLEGHSIAPERIAVVVGSSRGPVNAAAEAMEQLQRGRVFPSTAAHATPASLSGVLAGMIGASGPCFVISAACASSATAIATAAQLILCGAADVALVGGAEAPLHPAVLAQLHAAGVLAMTDDPAQACRPFDVRRSGTVLGEGAAFLVLESIDSVHARSARSHASLAGWGLATEPGERAGISSDSHGLATAMQQALSLANLSPEDISHVNAHGTGTVLNDLQEARAIDRVFADAPPLVTSTKPLTGHCMGASAALEAVIAIQAMNNGLVPPTPNCDQPDPDCAIELVRLEPQGCETDAVMTNSSGFWGNHASLIFAQP